MNKRIASLLVLTMLSAAAQQPADPLLPAPLPMPIAGSGIRLTLERAFRAHDLKGESFAYVDFSPDGKTLATGTSDGSARLWTLAGEQLLRVQNKNMVFKVRFHRDGQRFITAVYDGTAKLWDREGKLLHTYTGHRSAVTDALFLAGDDVATGSDDGSVIVFDAAGKQVARVVQRGVARNQAVAPDGKSIACAFDSGEIRVTDAKGTVLHGFATAQGRINDVRFSPDGKQLLTSGFDSTARFWSLDGKPLASLDAGDGDWVYSAQFSRDGALVGAVSGTGLITVWSAKTGQRLAEYRTGHGRVNGIGFSPTEDRFAVIDHNGVLLMFTYQRQ